MRKIYKFSLFTLLFITLTNAAFTQNRLFQDVGENKSVQTTGEKAIIPQKFRTSTMDVQAMKSFLWTLPSESSVMYNRGNAPVLSIPMPDGSMARFHVWESNIMEPALAAKFPDMKQFLGQGIDDPYATIRFDYNPYTGFHAQVLSAKTGRIFIDPFANGDVNNYMSYFARNAVSQSQFVCNVDENLSLDNPDPSVNRTAAVCLGTDLRTYRLALACTGEYAVAVNGATPTTGGVAAAMLTAVNRVTGVYENEVSVRLQLVANNDLLIYLDGTTDPYTNNNGPTMLGQNQTNCDAIIGSANYDIGHVFSTGGGGVAGLGVICSNGNKARGVTGLSNPTGDPFYIDYVAHEMGHQFGGNHTFNSVTGSCGGGNRNNSTAYEVGSGTSIQAYAGICGTDNTQNNSDPYFHAISFDEISNRINSTSCAAVTATGNTLPVIDPLANSGLFIPVSTPFTLSGTASDANGDNLTYSWEEMDLGPGGAWNSGATSTIAPLFKSRIPKTTGVRTFPDIAVILAGYPTNPPATLGGLKGETLPTVARAMKFRLTVRDNRAGGSGVVSSGTLGCQTSTPFIVNVAGTTPFAVTSPNGGESFAGGTTQTITWNDAGTTAAPFNVANVKISLSTDGGLTYPTVIVASTPNDGSEALTIPAVVTTTARIKIEAVGNIFFDISNANFTITAAPNGFSFNSPAAVIASCPAPNVMTSGNLTATYQGTFTGNINLSGTVSPAGATVSFSNNPLTTGSTSTTVSLTGMATLNSGNYIVTVTGAGVGGTTITRDITFTINPGSGPAVNTQPANQTVCVGANATFSVVSPTATNYQWQVSTTGVPAYTNIGGATSANYTANSVTVGMSGNLYRCVVSSQCGSTNSSAATLTVNTAPAISAQPQSITLCAGSNHTFSVGATGSNLTYQWQISTTAVPAFTNIPTAIASSYTVNGITAGMNGDQYRVVVSGSCPSPATSTAATLTVVSPVTVTGQPANTTVCDGGNATFTVAGSGAGVIYKWQVSAGGSGFVDIFNTPPYSGVNAATLTITGASPSMNGYLYRCLLSNATCTTPAISNAAMLTVNTLPAISGNPVSATICVGGSNTFSSTASGTGIGYQWQISTTAIPAFTNIPTATASSYTVTGASAGMNGNQYRVVVTGTCAPAANSTAATLTVIIPVAVATQPTAATEICSGSNTSLTVSGTSTQPITYQWQVSTVAVPAFTDVANGNGISGANSATLTFTNSTVAMNGTYRVQLSNTSCTAPTTSANAVLIVRQLPTVGLTASLSSLLPGQTSLLTATPSAQTVGTLTTTWLYNGNTIANAGNTRLVNVEQVGTYKLTIKEVFSGVTCSNQSADVVINATVSDRLFIFPSPNDGNFTVSYYNNGGSSTKRKIAIYDSKGASVYNAEFAISGPYTLLKINLEKAARGLYFVVIGDATGKKLSEGKVHVR